MRKNMLNEAEIRAESKSKAGRLFGYCAKHEGIQGVALLDGKQNCLGFISLENIQQKIDKGPYIEV